ncbi:MAG: hypothetical protein IJ744_10180 [Lachnospiraceae bacterium]|nr:hypothetical protein [Lachnospiraceae bacterium]
MVGFMAIVVIPVTVALVFLSIYLFMKGAKTEESKYTALGIAVLLLTLFLWWMLVMFITGM